VCVADSAEAMSYRSEAGALLFPQEVMSYHSGRLLSHSGRLFCMIARVFGRVIASPQHVGVRTGSHGLIVCKVLILSFLLSFSSAFSDAVHVYPIYVVWTGMLVLKGTP
jgi:hypothetical protein